MTFINFLATRPGTYTQALFGTKTPFMNENQTFRKMGLALLMLRSLQLLLCCYVTSPCILIQAKIGSELHQYLVKIGFNAYDLEEATKKSLTKIDGIRFLEGDDYVFLVCSSVVSPRHLPHMWSKSEYTVWGSYMQKHDNTVEGDVFLDDDVMAIFPFPVSGNYIDQAASHLIFMGHPFFYHCKPPMVCQQREEGRRQRQVVLYGRNYNQFKKDSQLWFQGQHIQLVNQWLFRDTEHPLLNEFFVFPIDISTTFRSFNEFTVDMDVLLELCTASAETTILSSTSNSFSISRMYMGGIGFYMLLLIHLRL